MRQSSISAYKHLPRGRNPLSESDCNLWKHDMYLVSFASLLRTQRRNIIEIARYGLWNQKQRHEGAIKEKIRDFYIITP